MWLFWRSGWSSLTFLACHNSTIEPRQWYKNTGSFYITSWQEEEDIESNTLCSFIGNRDEWNPVEMKLPLLCRCSIWRNSVNPLLLTSTSQQSHGQNSTVMLFITIAGTSWTEISKTDMSFIYSTFCTWHIGMLLSVRHLNKGLSIMLKKPQMMQMPSIHCIKWELQFCSF